MPRTPHLLNLNATVKVITYNDSLKEDHAFRRRVLAPARTVTSIKESSHSVRTVKGVVVIVLIVRGLLPENSKPSFLSFEA